MPAAVRHRFIEKKLRSPKFNVPGSNLLTNWSHRACSLRAQEPATAPSTRLVPHATRVTILAWGNLPPDGGCVPFAYLGGVRQVHDRAVHGRHDEPEDPQPGDLDPATPAWASNSRRRTATGNRALACDNADPETVANAQILGLNASSSGHNRASTPS